MGIWRRSLLLVGLSLMLLSGFPNSAFAAPEITSISLQYFGPNDASIIANDIRFNLQGIFNVNNLDTILVLPSDDDDFEGPRIILTIFDEPNGIGNVIER